MVAEQKCVAQSCSFSQRMDPRACRAELSGLISKYGDANHDSEVLDRLMEEANLMRAEMRIRCALHPAVACPVPRIRAFKDTVCPSRKACR